MKKEVYEAPHIKVRKIDSANILAASTISTGVSEDTATESAGAKKSLFSLGEDDDAPSKSSINWDN